MEVTPALCVKVCEFAQPSDLVQAHYDDVDDAEPDPFGLVLWPGALFAARRLCEHDINGGVAGRTCLVMGAGTGLEALTAAALGAERVLACDYNELTLELLDIAAQESGLDGRIECCLFDMATDLPLPAAADVHVYADVLYTRELAQHVARRWRAELWGEGGSSQRLMLTDSQKFHSAAFLDALNAPAGVDTEDDESERAALEIGTSDRRRIEWQQARLDSFTGSGILVEEDQTYDAEVRYLDLDSASLRVK